MDFTSFYPSIRCQYNLSMETVFVITVEQLLCAFQSEAEVLDVAIASKILRLRAAQLGESVAAMSRAAATERRRWNRALRQRLFHA